MSGKKNTTRSLISASAIAVASMGCASTTTVSPALLSAGSDLGEIRTLLAELAGVERVTIADDAFRNSPVLALQPAVRGPNARIATGRMDDPLRFQLNTDGKRCWLSQVGNDKRYVLKQTTCRPVP